ncbi:flagellar motor switch protein FliG [Paracoccus sp. SCSIO 75233]|uniref:flagellar motor switch protein FliG n=1 Tax=Paracoccus sp. SCSIO 75233 TaxID=3017782 RepID=UPI0022F118AF|nr:FliG C-terminal domain-containing protein [Paracoccus sp. SCSIO 75233]WBU52547.1 flagellar motor switch protein FliG [Paracoccus sp. SCSIO 75233]
MNLEPALSPRQKAAVIVRLLIGSGEDLSLEQLPPDAQSALAHEMALMGLVDRQTRDRVIEEFCESVEQVGVTFPGGLNPTLDLLGGTLSQDTADRLRRMAAMAGHSDPWDRIATLPARQIAGLAQSEAVEIAAVLFSKLPVPKAAEAFALMPADQARHIAYAMSLTSGIETPALRRIGVALLQAVDGTARPAIDKAPVEKVGAILNEAPSGTRDQVLTGLDEDDAAFAQEVRKAIFTWANIPSRIDPRDIPRIARAADPATLHKAIAGAKDADRVAAEFILSNLSSRMADGIRDEAEALGRVSSEDTETAMAEIVATIRRMEQAGDLFLISADTDDDGTEIAIRTAESA